MKIFATRGRGHTAADPERSAQLGVEERSGLPRRFAAVGEALLSGSDVIDVCSVAGQELARDGASMQETLEALQLTWQSLTGTDPTYDVVTALLTAWSETTLGYLHQLSCEDPLTGLSSQAHLRSRISELYRLHAITAHALVVCALPPGDPSEQPRDHFTRAMRMARAGALARTAFARDETVARLGAHQVAILTGRDDRMGRRVHVLRTMLEGIGTTSDGARVRVWIEGLPASDDSAGLLLDELARG